MPFISRSDMGWPATESRVQPQRPAGVKVHYVGSSGYTGEHSGCVRYWTGIRNMHLANKEENYSDVAYNLAVCQHGYILEGRGAGHQTGANGNQSLNRTHYAIVVLIGGSTEPSAAAVQALKEAILYLRLRGAGNEIKGHKDGFATSCPGGPLYSLVQSGSLEPGDYHDPGYEPFPGAGWFVMGRTSPIVGACRRRLIEEGCGRYQSENDKNTIGSGDKRSYEAWQRKCGFTGAAATWPPGKTTWDRLKVPNV